MLLLQVYLRTYYFICFQSSRIVRERKRVAWILLLLALLFACCWMPLQTVLLLNDIYDRQDHERLRGYLLLLGHANSAINPIIYCVMSKNFRRSVKELVCGSTINLMMKRNNRNQVS